MLLGFKTELKLNNFQRTVLVKHCGVSRHAWNWGLALTRAILEHNSNLPDNKLKFPTAIDLHKYLVALVKSENPWYYECSKSAPQAALVALSIAWKRCFKKISSQPRFKKKGKNDSFTLEGTCKINDNFTIQVPKIGQLKTYERLPQIDDKIKSVTISRQADKWFISFKIDTQIQDNGNLSVVGVDLGLKSLATLSTGEVIERRLSYRKDKAKLSRLQWLNRNKIIGSKNWRKAQLKIARLHRKIANIRKDTIHFLTSLLAKNHGTIVIEDLNVSRHLLQRGGSRYNSGNQSNALPWEPRSFFKRGNPANELLSAQRSGLGMMKNYQLGGAISDIGFYLLRRQLEYKCKLYGCKLVVVDRWFPSSKICSNCGHKKEVLKLSERVFSCENCNFKIDRDLNAAINLSHCVAGVPPVVANGVSMAVS